MKIDILTLFPNMFSNVFSESIIKRAKDKNLVSINIYNIRDFSNKKNKQVDDTPYGGGEGMVLMCQPIFDAIASLKSDDSYIIMLTPDGNVYNQKKAYSLSKHKHIILLAGHYEGFDDRIRTIVDEEISIGDYILTGGEIPAMILTDSIVRLLDNVIKKESHVNDSFTNNLLDYPNYTKPDVYNGLKVPDVLLSGNHKNIREWRLSEQIKKTKERRPDILDKE